MGIVAICCIEFFLSFQFYRNEPEFPIELFKIDAVNAIFRDLLLASIFIFLRKHSTRVKQIAKNYSPIAIVALLWIGISLLIIHSLNLIFNVATLISVFTGVINNIFFVFLAGWLYTKWNNTLAKTIYFLTYFFTIFFFFSDTIYFFVTSSHIEKMVFDNLNSQSITSVIYTSDKLILLGILMCFSFLMLLFRTPGNLHHLPRKNTGVVILILICVAANLVNIATVAAYPRALIDNGFDEESAIEKSRNVSRDMLSSSVTVNLVREFLRNTEKHAAASQLHRYPFTEKETRLLSELDIAYDEKPALAAKPFPYEKVVVIVAESFHRDYLHFYNAKIPAEATQFLDGLLAKYPHSNYYYTANKPTTQGLNSMFLSQAIYTEDQSFENNATLFKTLEKNGYDTMFLEATSQYYNDEFRAYKKRFGMQTYRAKEALEKEGYVGSSGWGFHNDVMYEETIRLLEENRNNKVFIVTKTIDSHQPYPYCGFLPEDIPAAIKDQPNNLYLKAIYWENITLQKFFRDLEERKLLDDKTLVVVTSDHNPHPSQNDNYKRLTTEDMRISVAPIPLIFVSTNLQPFENFSSATYGSQIDFAPTLLGILGIASPPQFSGKNMLTIPPENSYAVGSCDETVYYWSSDYQIKTDMYSDKIEDPYEKALIHWVQDSYVRYFQTDTTAQ
ncbi:MAG: sulfatase [Firmicutes bacterium]|nr:sulfatase [Bacillota bacterium]